MDACEGQAKARVVAVPRLVRFVLLSGTIVSRPAEPYFASSEVAILATKAGILRVGRITLPAKSRRRDRRRDKRLAGRRSEVALGNGVLVFGARRLGSARSDQSLP